MNIASYIAALLAENDFVVLPGVGAFTSVYEPARLETDRSLLPPSQRISFLPEVKVNDGILADLLGHRLKIPYSEARRMVDQYAAETLYHLEQEGSAVLEGFGTLFLKEGAYTFIPDQATDLNPHSFGLKPVSTETSLNGIPSENREYEVQVKTGKRAAFYLLLVVAILAILVLAGYLFMRQDRLSKKSSEIPGRSEVIVPEDQPENSQEQIQPENQPDTVIIQEDTIPPHPRKALYYSIGGSFKSRENADDYFIKMERKGFQPIHLGLQKGFYLVALDTFLTVNEAYTAAFSYSRRFPGMDVWIFHEGE